MEIYENLKGFDDKYGLGMVKVNAMMETSIYLSKEEAINALFKDFINSLEILTDNNKIDKKELSVFNALNTIKDVYPRVDTCLDIIKVQGVYDSNSSSFYAEGINILDGIYNSIKEPTMSSALYTSSEAKKKEKGIYMYSYTEGMHRLKYEGDEAEKLLVALNLVNSRYASLRLNKEKGNSRVR